MYRVVYVHIEWVTDRLSGGEHHQDWGTAYVKARRVSHPYFGWVWQAAEPINKETTPSEILYFFSGDDQCGDDYIHPWSTCQPKWNDGWEEEDLIRLKIESAIKRNHSISYKDRVKEDESIANFSNFIW